MAAPTRKTFQELRFWKKLYFKTGLDGFASAICSKTKFSTVPQEPEVDIEEEINKLRDVSGMTPYRKAIMKGQTFDMDEMRQNQPSRRSYLRHMYAKYGKASGIDPSIIWPSERELEELVDIENNYTTSFDDLRLKVQGKKDAVQADMRERETKVEKAMEKMPQLIANFKAQEKKSDKAAIQGIEDIDEIHDQFIDHFGYEPKKRDAKYVEFKSYKHFELAIQRKQEKKESKQKKSPQFNTQQQKT